MKLFYDEDAANLNVTVVGADGLAPKETTTPPNPYVRIYFLPDKRYVVIFCLARNVEALIMKACSLATDGGEIFF